MQRRPYLTLGLRAALSLALAGCVATAIAQQPQPMKVIVGFAPGGSVDALARLVAESLQTGMKRNAIVENRTGAGGRLAVEMVKAAAPDGDTLLLAPQGPMTLFPFVFRNLRYDPAQDFIPVTRVASGDFALTIGPLVPAKEMKGFSAWLAGAGDKAAYGSPGAGTIPHFVGVAFSRQIGVPMTHVPYRGSALSMNDLAGGTLAAAVSPVTEALELHKAGRVTIVATTGPKRSGFVADVPTLKELGIDVVVPLWFAVYAPAATPPATLDRIRAAIHAGLATPAAKERIARLGLDVSPSGTPELITLQLREREMWEPVVKASGFTPGD
ncbi:MAG: ABC transporter substrate-binding protein [Burkholderiales bacterium]|nr:ABC transporter substrate-binding protein [Burkholderiales bacterium]